MYSAPVRRTGLLVLLLAAAGCGSDGGGPTTPPPPTTGTISGTIVAEGSGVAGATVALGTTTQTSSATGQFTFTGVAAGSHTLTLTPPTGYALDAGQTAQKSVTVAGGQTASVSWALRRSTGQAPQTVQVQMEASSFSPNEVSIGVGSTVRWVNALAVPHTITPSNASQAGAWAAQTVPAQQGYTFSHTFNTAGSYNYQCQVHAGMTGTVRVQ